MGIIDSKLLCEDSEFNVTSLHEIKYNLTYVDHIFSTKNRHLFECYKQYKRCVTVIDKNVYDFYGEQLKSYFDYFNIDLVLYPVTITETNKTIETFESIIDFFDEVKLLRKEPVLIIGGGLITDPVGFACSAYRRNTPYNRIPTTLIGLIDASVAIKVAVNHRDKKNRLGAYHASGNVFLDFSFLKTLPDSQMVNGMSELIKIAVVSQKDIFEKLYKYGVMLLETKFGNINGNEELRQASVFITYEAIKKMLQLEIPNLYELDLERVIAYGHSWSPVLELIPEPHMFHGHAVSIDMAFSATIAESRGYITSDAHKKILDLISNIGLSLDNPYFDEEVAVKGLESIVLTRDGYQQLAVPRPIGECYFINDLTNTEMLTQLKRHKDICRSYVREGMGTNVYMEQES
jgi:3-dehydroquinate synthase